jgi:hypothetical protein
VKTTGKILLWLILLPGSGLLLWWLYKKYGPVASQVIQNQATNAGSSAGTAAGAALLSQLSQSSLYTSLNNAAAQSLALQQAQASGLTDSFGGTGAGSSWSDDDGNDGSGD